MIDRCFPRSRRAVAFAAGIVSVLLSTTQTAVALPGEHNRLPEACQGVAGAAYTAHSALAIAIPPLFDLGKA